jgi:hypothetical protein
LAIEFQIHTLYCQPIINIVESNKPHAFNPVKGRPLYFGSLVAFLPILRFFGTALFVLLRLIKWSSTDNRFFECNGVSISYTELVERIGDDVVQGVHTKNDGDV